MLDVFLDSLLDSLKVFGIAFVLNVILSFFEGKISSMFQKHTKISPLLGAASGLIPQCGISIVAADMYKKEHITAGTLCAVFFACSDEALPILCSEPLKIVYIIPLLMIKFIFGFLLGYFIDWIIKKEAVKNIEEEIHIGCCHHEIDNQEENPLHCHLLHPLLHSIKIWIYVFIITFIFGLLFYEIGENQIIGFLKSNHSLGPIFAGVIGLIPNCASSVLLSELFLSDGLSFGALVTGLCVNSGLGIIYLLKYKDSRRNAFYILGVLFLYSILLGYLTFLGMQILHIT